MSVIPLVHHYFILRERSDRRTFSAEIEPFSGKILPLRCALGQDEVDLTE
jgi:hypothetical protein